MNVYYIYSSENERTANSNFIGQRSMSHTGDQVSSDGSLHNRNFLDNIRGLDSQIPGGQLLTSNEIQVCCVDKVFSCYFNLINFYSLFYLAMF